jgi:hypothetical protein
VREKESTTHHHTSTSTDQDTGVKTPSTHALNRPDTGAQTPSAHALNRPSMNPSPPPRAATRLSAHGRAPTHLARFERLAPVVSLPPPVSPRAACGSSGRTLFVAAPECPNPPESSDRRQSYRSEFRKTTFQKNIGRKV